MKYLKIIIPISILSLIFIIDYYNKYYKPNTSFEAESIFLYVMKDDSIAFKDSISKYIKSEKTFYKVAEKLEYLGNKKTGRFKIKRGIGNNDIVNSLRSNNIPLNLTFNNIETLSELAGKVSKKIEADSVSIMNAFTNKKFLNELSLTNESVFSLFIPNTYQFFWNTNATDFRERIVKEFDSFWNQTRINKIKEINLNPIEVMVLASIVQKETPKVDERPTIAGVYLNRLEKNMKLQADPTVVYSIKQRDGFDKVIRRVLYKDLDHRNHHSLHLFMILGSQANQK